MRAIDELEMQEVSGGLLMLALAVYGATDIAYDFYRGLNDGASGR